jgi:hypothetical protein
MVQLRLSVVPFCECGLMMTNESWHDAKSDGAVWFCSRCWVRYFVPWTYAPAHVLPELRSSVIERKPEESYG